MLVKLNNGEKISQRDAKALEEMKKQANVATDKMIEALKTKFGSEGSEEFIAFMKSTTENCVCSADIEKPKKGPNAEFYFSLDDDCKKCLEEQKKKHEQAAQVIKKVQKFLSAEMMCGCFTWGSILRDFGHEDKNCEEIVEKMNSLKQDFKTSLEAHIEVLAKLKGQVRIDNTCIDNFSIEISNNASMDVTSAPTDEYNEPNREFDDNELDLYNDRTRHPNTYLRIKTDNKFQAQLVEKWLFAPVKEKTVKQEKIDFAGTISSELLKKIFPNVKPDRANELLPFINQYLKEFKMNTCEERIMFFSQIAEETDNLGLLTEEKSGWASSNSKYKGRGMFQLTGSRNYKKFGEYCKSLKDDIDFVNDPEKINNPKYAVLSAFWYWEVNNCKKYSSKLTEENMLKIAKITNCGSINSNCSHNDQEEPCNSCKPNGWEKRKTEFERLKNSFPCK